MDRTIAPELSPFKGIVLQQPNIFTLPNHIKCFLFQFKDSQTLSFTWQIAASRWHEPTHGLAQVLATMLRGGTQHKNNSQIAELIAQTGGNISFTAEPDFFLVHLHCLASEFKTLLGILSELMYESIVPEYELEIQKNRISQNLTVQLEKNSVLASRYLMQKLYGEDCPYGKSLFPKDLEQINRETLLDFNTGYLQTSESQLFLTGAYTDSDLQALAQALAPQKSTRQNIKRQVAQHNIPFEYHEARPAAVQSSVLMSKLLPKGTYFSENEPVFILLNDILGGYFGSRLNQNLREKRGLTYAVHSWVALLQHSERWNISADVGYQRREEAIEAIRYEMSYLQQELVSDEELEAAKSYRKGAFLNSFKNLESFASRYQLLHNFGLSGQHYDQYFDRLESVTAQQIRDLASKYLQDFATVSVG
ncbi:MAG: insulinase family protein [Cytophagales bacterium]|nr:MAG: insulinase family protein [Cytophagales bacterium]TAF61385.1 MAG: insulinase family protein [Cytophagales bacterium]